MANCKGDCLYVDQWVDNLRDFETWTIRWYDQDLQKTKGVSGPGCDALNEHAKELKFQGWIKACAKGCQCQGNWKQPLVTTINMRVVDSVYGAIAICTADLHRKEYEGKCKNPAKGG
jgi:hypothetical protein